MVENHQINDAVRVTPCHYISDLVSFPNNIFAQTYIEPAQKRLVVEKFKNGVALPTYPTATISHTTETSGIHHVSSCTYNNQTVVLYSHFVVYRIYGRIVYNNGTFRGPEFAIGSVGIQGTMPYCIQTQPNEILLLYGEDPTNSNANWNTYYNTLNPETMTFGTQQILNADNTAGEQYFPSITKLISGNYLISICGDSPNFAGLGLHLYQLDSSYNILNGGNRLEVPNTGSTATTRNRQQNVRPLSNGGFIIVYFNQGNLFYTVYNSSMTQTCTNTKIYNSAVYSKVEVYNDIAYIVLYELHPIVQVTGIEIDPVTCSVIDINPIHVGQIYGHSLSMAISKDTDTVESAVIAVTFVAKTTPSQLILYEYLIEQVDSSGNQNNCTDTVCLGCYGTYTCPTCVGSDSTQMAIRKNGPNSCTCDNGYYDEFPTILDCKPCQFPCANCQNDTHCDTCATTDPNQSPAPNCLCNFGFVRNGTDTMCSSCSHKCNGCTGTITTCDNCSHSTRQGSSCDCIPGYYDDGINPQCAKCDRRCATCQPDGFTCIIQCDTNCRHCDTIGQCIECLIGYYLDDNNKCVQCNPKCVACSSQSKDQCLLCAKGIGRSMNLLQDQCGCKNGYYDDGTSKDCKPCKIQDCKICDSNGECLECENKKLDPKNCKDKILSLSVGVPYFQDSNGNFICKQGQNRLQEYPCNCEQGYYSSTTNYNCKKCPKGCSSCINEQICTECIQNRVLKNKQNLKQVTAQCECDHGFKEDINRICQKCYSFEGKCFQECPKNTFQNQNIGLCEQEQQYAVKNFVLIHIIWIVAFIIYIFQITTISSIFQNKNQKISSKNKNEQNNM